MPKTVEELIERNERQLREKVKDAERKEKSRLYNLQMRAIDISNREEERKRKAMEYYHLKKEQKKTTPNIIQQPTKNRNTQEFL